MSNIFFTPITNSLPVKNTTESSVTPFEAQQSFSSCLKDSINKVNRAQIESDDLTKKLILGKDVDLHQVMIASQKASITTQLTLEIRNKAVEAYQAMMRMQV